MNTLSRAALLGAGSAIALVGLPRMTSFVEAAEKADPGDIATLNAAVELRIDDSSAALPCRPCETHATPASVN